MKNRHVTRKMEENLDVLEELRRFKKNVSEGLHDIVSTQDYMRQELRKLCEFVCDIRAVASGIEKGQHQNSNRLDEFQNKLSGMESQQNTLNKNVENCSQEIKREISTDSADTTVRPRPTLVPSGGFGFGKFASGHSFRTPLVLPVPVPLEPSFQCSVRFG